MVFCSCTGLKEWFVAFGCNTGGVSMLYTSIIRNCRSVPLVKCSHWWRIVHCPQPLSTNFITLILLHMKNMKVYQERTEMDTTIQEHSLTTSNRHKSQVNLSKEHLHCYTPIIFSLTLSNRLRNRTILPNWVCALGGTESILFSHSFGLNIFLPSHIQWIYSIDLMNTSITKLKSFTFDCWHITMNKSCIKKSKQLHHGEGSQKIYTMRPILMSHIMAIKNPQNIHAQNMFLANFDDFHKWHKNWYHYVWTWLCLVVFVIGVFFFFFLTFFACQSISKKAEKPRKLREKVHGPDERQNVLNF